MEKAQCKKGEKEMEKESSAPMSEEEGGK